MGLPDIWGIFYGIWAQGISIKITIQEINTHHRINGGFNFHWETQLYIYVPLPCLITPGYIQRWFSQIFGQLKYCTIQWLLFDPFGQPFWGPPKKKGAARRRKPGPLGLLASCPNAPKPEGSGFRLSKNWWLTNGFTNRTMENHHV